MAQIVIDADKLPKGMDAKKLAELVQRAEKNDERARVYNEARRKALTELSNRHRAEYESLLKQYNPNSK